MPKVSAVIIIITLILSGCLTALPPHVTETTVPAGIQAPLVQQVDITDPPAAAVTVRPTLQPATVTSTVTLTPTGTATAVPMTATPTAPACIKVGGRIEISEVTTTLLPQPLVYRVYLPPCYDTDVERTYPVLYLVHGQSYNDDQWDRLGVPETANRLIGRGEIPPFIVVMPADRVWREPTDDKFGLAVAQTLVPWIDQHYRTIPDRAHRAVGGLSRGGAWAIHIGLASWELFGSIGVHSGFVFHSDVQPIYTWLYAIPDGETPRIYMDIGNSDRPDITQGAVWLEGLLTKFAIPHEWHMFVGEHQEEYWRSHIEDYLRWYTLEWKN